MFVISTVMIVCFFFLFWEVKITKNKNDSIQVFFCLFVCFVSIN